MITAESKSQLRRLESNDSWEDNRPHVVLISGKAGVGKTTLAHTLSKVVREHEDQSSVIMKQSIAWGVKVTAKDMGWDGEKDVKGRRLLQGIGQIGRAYDPDTWVEIANKGILDNHYYCGSIEGISLRYVWVDDLRFKNEIAWFQGMDYLYRVHLVRITAPNREILQGTPEADDISETDLDLFRGFDFVVDNRGSLDELWATANMIYNRIQ